MSVFGGDSWAREANHRKRRVDDLLLPSSSSSSYKKLSNGKLACLVCPDCPVLDSPIALSIHCNGSRHAAAQARLRDRELRARADAEKRIALSGDTKKPMIEREWGAAAERKVVLAGSSDGVGGAVVEEENGERRKRREMELRFTAAGWKRDCHGKWYRDENVEFDSDDEDPNTFFHDN